MIKKEKWLLKLSPTFIIQKKIIWVLFLITDGNSMLSNGAFWKDHWLGCNRAHVQNRSRIDMSVAGVYLLGYSSGLTPLYFFQDYTWVLSYVAGRNESLRASWELLAPCCPEWYRHVLTHFTCKLAGALS